MMAYITMIKISFALFNFSNEATRKILNCIQANLVILCHFIVLHRCCMFYKLKFKQKDYDLFYYGGLEPNPQYLRNMPICGSCYSLIG